MKAKSLKRKIHKKRGVGNKEQILKEASFKQVVLIDSLLETSILPNKQYKILYDRMKFFISEGQAEELIVYLKENQRDNIDGGFNYSASDIKDKLKWINY